MKNHKTKRIFIVNILLCLVSLMTFNKCNKNDETEEETTGNWIRLSSLDGVARCDAVAFSINGKGYICTGYDGKKRLNDLWEYDPDKNSWQQKNDFPGTPRNGAVGFVINNKAYIATGYDGYNMLKDVWEYDPIYDSWTKKNDFAGTARYGAVAFTIKGKGYIATGYDGRYLKDLWEYDPVTDQWQQKSSLSGEKRHSAVAFVIGDSVVYICTGINNGVYVNDLWQYNPLTDLWTKKNYITNYWSDKSFDDNYNMTGINRVALTINNKGYLITGGESTAGSDVWEYDPTEDLWIKKTSFEGSARTEACGFVINNIGYILTGRNGSNYYDDLWSFYPDEEYNAYD